MAEKVTFSMGHFGPFEGVLLPPDAGNSSAFRLTFGPLYVNAAALSNEPYVHVQKKRETVVFGPYTGTIRFDPESYEVYGNLIINQ